MPVARRFAANPAVMKTEEIQPLTIISQIHDPGLGVLEVEPELRQDHRERLKSALGLLFAAAYRQQIVCIPNQYSAAALVHCRSSRCR